jgi:endoglucanase
MTGKNIVKNNFLFLNLFLFLLIGFVASGQKLARKDLAFEQNAKLGRGINIIGYDAAFWKDFNTGRFKEKYFKMIKDAGFSSIRINLHPFKQMDSKYIISPTWLETLDWVVKKGLEAKLMIILDMHEFNAMADDPIAKKEMFLSVWRQIAFRYKDQPSDVVFELLNEPNQKLTIELWNEYLVDALKIIRKTNPTRTVIIGPGNWNGIESLQTLKLPKGDKNIIVTVHFYHPMSFTHQGAPWSKNTKDVIGIKWTATQEEKELITSRLKVAADWSVANDRPIFLGEFGAYDKGEINSRARYTAFVARTAEKFGFSWAYWQFDSDFIVYNIDREAWVEPIKKSLLPTKSFVPASYQGEAFTDTLHSAGPQVIPGKVECALYDMGGEGIAYHDFEIENRGSGGLNKEPIHKRPHATAYDWEFRIKEGVDLSYAKDFADFNHLNNYYIPKVNQLYIGWTENNEWVNYTVDVKVAGNYRIDALYAFNDSTITFDVDQQLASTCKLPLNTGSYHSWNKSEIGNITFSEPGLHLLTFHYNKGNNFAYFEFTLIEKKNLVLKH